LAYLGARFRILLDLPERVSDVDAGKVLLERYIMVHLQDDGEKFALLIEMISKLYRLADDEIAPDNPDSLMNHVLPLF
jgi:DNA-directed RNA polymerase I subunit RPA2